jgi:uridylate kinase
MEHKMPILVFNFSKDGNILKAVRGEKVGTMITPQSEEVAPTA